MTEIILIAASFRYCSLANGLDMIGAQRRHGCLSACYCSGRTFFGSRLVCGIFVTSVVRNLPRTRGERCEDGNAAFGIAASRMSICTSLLSATGVHLLGR